MSLEKIHKTNQKVWRWQRDSHIAGLAGGLGLVGGVLTASHPVLFAGLAVMVSARIGGEWVVEGLKKNVIAQQKTMIQNVGNMPSVDLTTEVDLMSELVHTQSVRQKVRAAISSAYIAVGGSVLFAPLLTSNPNDAMFVASAVVGAFAGYTAGRAIETLARNKYRFYDNAPGIATAITNATLQDKVLARRMQTEGVVLAQKPKV